MNKINSLQLRKLIHQNHEVVLRDELWVNGTKLSKIYKHGKRLLLKNPFLFFSKKNLTIKVHYDMYHGYGELDKAIEFLDNENREDFRTFVETQPSFNANNILICRSAELYSDYCKSLFQWLEKYAEFIYADNKIIKVDFSRVGSK